MARLLKWIVEAVTEREGEAPRAVGLTHPANWGDYKRDLLVQAVRIAGLEKATLLSEPEAAAIHYASLERVEPGTLVAVYDLGGGTFDAAVLRKRGDDSFEVLGQPEGIERLGGIDFDEAIFRYVLRAVGDPIQSLDADDPAVMSAFVRLREECVEAKEALSSDTEATIPVLLPNVQSEVRLTRSEFEAMVRPTLTDTIDALRRALRSAGVEASELDKVLLVGGSSRIPIVAQMVSAALDRPVAVDTDPKLAVASGAAMAATRALAGGGAPKATPTPSVLSAETAAPVPKATLASTSSTATARTPSPDPDPVPFAGGGGGRGKTPLLLGGLAAAAIVALVAVFVLSSGGDGGDGGDASGTTTSTTAAALALASGKPVTTTTLDIPSNYEGYIQITGISIVDDTYAIAFDTGDQGMDIANHHAHFFWNTTPRSTAGTNGTPKVGEWLPYADASPAINAMFKVANRPEGATSICALVGNGFHEIADVTGDGQEDPDSGNCWVLPAS
jgi:actin-like ATPase involved in cell morphogenesis